MSKEPWELINAHEVDPRVHGLEGLLEKQFSEAKIHFYIRGSFAPLSFKTLQKMQLANPEIARRYYYGVTRIEIEPKNMADKADEVAVDMQIEGEFTGRNLESFAKQILAYKGIEELLIRPEIDQNAQTISESPDTTQPNPPSQ